MERDSKRAVMMVITLVAGVALAASESGYRGLGDQDAWAMDETTGSAGSSGGKSAPELALSDEQRGRIYDSVMRIADAPVAQALPPAVADALPPGVPMQDLPAAVARDVPPVRGHKFVKFDDRIVVVDPASRLVVAMIPRYRLLP
ncbi:MAG TPA: hypothetical protein VE251_08655 [Xanthobacteraceae bacterium]|nr:hypothetical protein [Xanthobacteraceae bacterium]